MKSWRFSLLTALLWAGAAVLSAAADAKKIIFLAGPKDHGLPGRHEYERDLRALAHCLQTSANLRGVETVVHVGRAPRDPAFYDDAAAIVIHSSSDRHEKETHPLFPPQPLTDGRGYDPETSAFLKELDGRIKKGMGVVIFHYAAWAENWAARGLYYDWTGGLWVQMVSRNPNDHWSMVPKDDTHPVNRGVNPWSYRDEVFCRFFLPEDPRRTDLLVGTPEKARLGPQVVSWAYQRDDGGRGFVMGGVDFHDNLQVEDYRRFLLNGIAWAAGLDIPADGVNSTLPEAW